MMLMLLLLLIVTECGLLLLIVTECGLLLLRLVGGLVATVSTTMLQGLDDREHAVLLSAVQARPNLLVNPARGRVHPVDGFAIDDDAGAKAITLAQATAGLGGADGARRHHTGAGHRCPWPRCWRQLAKTAVGEEEEGM